MYFFLLFFFFFFFFFQAEDGIRDTSVTGVQTCALPIYGERLADVIDDAEILGVGLVTAAFVGRDHNDGRGVRLAAEMFERSEERRVGKECRSRWSRDH